MVMELFFYFWFFHIHIPIPYPLTIISNEILLPLVSYAILNATDKYEKYQVRFENFH